MWPIAWIWAYSKPVLHKMAYGTDKLPESFIIDRAGRVVAVSRGEIGERFLARALELARSS